MRYCYPLPAIHSYLAYEYRPKRSTNDHYSIPIGTKLPIRISLHLINMPVIDSKKYACEPCIRGHRATKCSHTTRLQVLVRKPGRPMQNCAHEFGACVCGRIGEVGEDWGADGDGPKEMSKSVGYDARETSNVIAIMGSVESRKNVLKTKSKKEKEKVKKGGTSDVQKSKVKKRAKGPTSSSQSNSCPPSICKVSGQQEVIEHSSDIQPESIDVLDPTYPKIPIPSSTSIPTISNFLPTITTLIPQVQDHTILSSQMLYNDQSPTLIFHQHQNDQASLRTPFSTPFLRY